MDDLQRAICERIDNLSDQLLEVSHSIHANPELAFKEFHAAETLTNALKSNDLAAERGVFTLETAFEAY